MEWIVETFTAAPWWGKMVMVTIVYLVQVPFTAVLIWFHIRAWNEEFAILLFKDVEAMVLREVAYKVHSEFTSRALESEARKEQRLQILENRSLHPGQSWGQ